MSEEEKKAVEKFNNLYIKEFNGEPITTDDRLSYIECALITNLIEKLEQELNNIKEIEKSHQEENGKLRVEFEKVYEDNLTLANELKQEKEKNKELEEKCKEVVCVPEGTCFLLKPKDVISKDKIKEKIEEINEEKLNYSEDEYYLENEIKGYTIDKLKDLLEEK